MAWAAPRTWTVGQVVTAAQMNEIRDSLNEVGGAWVSWTPTITASGTAFAAGNATMTCFYRQVNRTLHVTGDYVFGSTTTFGTGTYKVSVPGGLTISTSLFQQVRIGTGTVRSAGVNYNAEVRFQSGDNTAFTLYVQSAITTWAQVGAAAPGAMAANDYLSFHFSCPVN